jgi:hypothetical protein
MTKERTNAMEAFYQARVPMTTHIITFDHQLNKQQQECKTINVIILEKAKMLLFFGQMYKSNYYIEEQMIKYKKRMDANKTWVHTLQYFTTLIAQRKAYKDNWAANSKFNSAAHINNTPTNCSVVSTTSDITTRNLCIKSLKESLMAARE